LSIFLEKVIFTAVIVPNFYDLTRIFLDYFWQILLVSCAESCLQAVHSTEFAKGLRETRQPLESRSWITQSLPSGMWSALTL
jgi:hypothetical protein